MVLLMFPFSFSPFNMSFVQGCAPRQMVDYILLITQRPPGFPYNTMNSLNRSIESCQSYHTSLIIFLLQTLLLSPTPTLLPNYSDSFPVAGTPRLTHRVLIPPVFSFPYQSSQFLSFRDSFGCMSQSFVNEYVDLDSMNTN